jgi:hypothetical protein
VHFLGNFEDNKELKGLHGGRLNGIGDEGSAVWVPGMNSEDIVFGIKAKQVEARFKDGIGKFVTWVFGKTHF